MDKRDIPATLAVYLNDPIVLNKLKSECIANYGYNEYARMLKQANIIANTKPYTFTDFSPQVISRSDDKSSVRQDGHTGHNED